MYNKTLKNIGSNERNAIETSFHLLGPFTTIIVTVAVVIAAAAVLLQIARRQCKFMTLQADYKLSLCTLHSAIPCSLPFLVF